VIQLIPGQHIHIVGIGGFGLSAIARVLLQQGFYISGSDRATNTLTDELAKEGATIHQGHDAAHVAGAELVVISSAIPTDHVEIVAARERGIPVYKRSDIIAAVMSGQGGIAVAGTHGKTTTTAMAAHMLLETDQRPSYIIGGILRSTGHNADIGTGRAFVIEADEYDNMFLGLRPRIAVVTNVEWDHPDFFPTPNHITRAFSQFVNLLPDNGLLIACADDATAMIFAENRLVLGFPVATYGIENSRAMWRAVNIRTNRARSTTFEVSRGGRILGTAQLQIPGRHNVLNALAALIIAQSQQVSFSDAARALQKFTGTGRRFEQRGEVDGVVVVDDYAHHPTAIQSTLEATRQRYPGRKVWAVWQPHTYSRTKNLLERFAIAFDKADHVLVTDIYAAREQPIANVTGETVVKAIQHADARYTGSLNDTVTMLEKDVEAPAVILIMSAGNAPYIGFEYLKGRQKKKLAQAHDSSPSIPG
jgi:UDP-N-acetylmuramate--alanine ligase